MDLEQVMAELEMLKADNMAGKQEKRMGSFVDKYGTKFNNNSEIANLILAEMDRRGVDEASEAASEAVQSVLDQLRSEATMVMDSIKGSEQQVSDLMDKLTDIQESVDAATQGAPMGEPPMGEGALPPDMGGVPPPPPDMGGGVPSPDAGLPAGGEGGGAPPPDMGAPPPPDMGAPPPPDMGAPPPGEEPIPPPPPPPPPMAHGGFVPSDARLKNIRGKFQAYAAGRKQTVPSDKNIKKPMWKPSASILEGVKAGF